MGERCGRLVAGSTPFGPATGREAAREPVTEEVDAT